MQILIKTNERKLFNLKTLDVYYAKDIRDYNVDIIHFIQNKQYMKGANIFKTIIIDLTKEKEELFRNFSKSLRRAIRKINEIDEVEFFYNFYPTQNEIKEYVKYFSGFSKAKQIYSCDKPLLERLSKIGCLGIVGVREKETGKILVYNTYIQDGVRARGQYSVSMTYKYSHDKEKRKFIANANKALEWYAINLYKEKGYIEYDLGGVTLDANRPEMDGIDQYKMQFGGTLNEEYNYSYGYSVKGKVTLLVKKIVNKIRIIKK